MSKKSEGHKSQQGRFVPGLIVGLLIGLAVALGVALYVTKAPIPFINKLPQRTAEQDVEEAKRNQNWDPNAPLASKTVNKAASGVVSVAPPAASSAPAPAPAAVTPPAPEAAKKAEAKPAAAAASAAPGTDPFVYFVQVGAFTRADDAEQQRAKLALLGFAAKVTEKEQSGRTVFRVRLGPLDTRDEADGLQQKVQAAGVEANLVRVQR